VSIHVEAFPDKTFRGVVTRIDPQASTQQNITTILVTVQVENADALLKPGMTASCDFLVERVEDTLYLPSRAIREVGGSHVVTLVRGREQVEAPVEIGVVGNDRTEILEGLSEGTEVVLPGLAGSSEGSSEQARAPGPPGGVGSFFRSSR
jgi:multidrug efflux pump subunit AcrA (membrane-fusion protein)